MALGTARGIKRTKRVAYSDWERYQKLERAQLSEAACAELGSKKAATPMDGIRTVQVDADVLAELKTKMDANADIVSFSQKIEDKKSEVASLERRKNNIGAIGMSQEFQDTVANLRVAKEELEQYEEDLTAAFKRAGRESEIAA